MQAHSMRSFRNAVALLLVLCGIIATQAAQAAPYAAMVMDARNGEVIFARNHDTRLHPASLTKMMTLYVAFEAIKHGEVTLDTQFTTSRRATQQACVCLGLRQGQKLSLRYLIRAAALRSANDAAVVIAEGISGSVEAFGERMTRTARAMGMSNTTFLNPHGLTQTGHVSTARDMTILGRQLYFDYPQYYNIFSRRSDHAGVATVPNTNRRFLDAYSGADGIKTGYTRAAGFNLTASAQRGGKHIIVTMFGGSSAAARNAHVAELMDIGFSRAATRVATRAPSTPGYQGRGTVAVAQAPVAPTRNGDDDAGAAAKTIRLQMAVRRSLRPTPRPARDPDPAVLLAVRESVDAVVSDLAAAVSVEGDDATAEVAALAPDTLPLTPPARPETILADAEDRSPAAEDELALAAVAGFRMADPLPEDPEAEDRQAAAAPLTEDRDETSTTAQDSLAMAVAAGFPLADPDLTPDTDDMPEPESQAQAAAQETPEAQPDARAASEGVDFATAAGVDAALPLTAPADGTEVAAELSGQPADPDEGVIWIGAEASFMDDGPQPLAGPDTPAGLQAELDAAPDTAQALSGITLTSATVDVRDDAELHAIASAAEARGAIQSVPSAPEIIPRLSTSDGGRLWGVSLGQFNSRAAAERSLITVKMAEANALGNGVSRIRQTSGRFEASFAGLTQTEAERACLRLQARRMDCILARP